MSSVTSEWLAGLAEIYRDIFQAFPAFNPQHRAGEGVAFQSLYSMLNDKYTLTEIREACEQLARGGAVEIRNGIFAHPTALGEEIIEKLTDHLSTQRIPPFSPPPGN